ncbi:hypothetical protein GCM10027288_37740 [Bordetella tumbae]
MMYAGMSGGDKGQCVGFPACGDQALFVPEHPTVGEADMATPQIQGNRFAVAQKFDIAAHPGVFREHLEPGLFYVCQDSLGQGWPLVRSVAFTTEHRDATSVALLAQGVRRDCRRLARADDDNAWRRHLLAGDNT